MPGSDAGLAMDRAPPARRAEVHGPPRQTSRSGAELPYVFAGPVQSSGAIVFTPAEQALSDAVVDAWARFAVRGRPGGDGLRWPRLDRRSRHLVLDTPPTLGSHLKEDLCAWWKSTGWSLAPSTSR